MSAIKKPSTWRIELGRAGEAAAIDWLTKQGWYIRDTNWRCGHAGEIDIIAQDDTDSIVFIEVKTRRLKEIQAGFRNEGFESVHWRKRKKIVSLAFDYLSAQKLSSRQCRFDVIVVEYIKNTQGNDLGKPAIHHVSQAF